MRRYIQPKGQKSTAQNLLQYGENVLYLSDDEMKKRGYSYFNLYQCELNAKGILYLCIGASLLVLLLGLLIGKISTLESFKLSFYTLIFFLLLLGGSYLTSDKPHKKAKLLLTDSALIYFWNDKQIYILPTDSLDFRITSGNDLILTSNNVELTIDPSGYDMSELMSFLLKAYDKSEKFRKRFNEFLSEYKKLNKVGES